MKNFVRLLLSPLQKKMETIQNTGYQSNWLASIALQLSPLLWLRGVLRIGRGS